MSDFFKTIVAMLSRSGFLDYPTRRRGLLSEVAIMAHNGHLVVVHGPYKSEYEARVAIVANDSDVSQFNPEQDRLDAIQHEFDNYLEQVILPIIDYYGKGFLLRSVKFVMPGGGELKFPVSVFDSKGIEVITRADAKDIRIDIPGIGSLAP